MTTKTRCNYCPPRKQCEDCRGWDEFRDGLIDGLSRKLADAIIDHRRQR